MMDYRNGLAVVLTESIGDNKIEKININEAVDSLKTTIDKVWNIIYFLNGVYEAAFSFFF